MNRPLLALAMTSALFAGAAGAAPVTLRINATVVAYGTDLGLLPFSGTAGDSFYVDYTFEASTTDSQPDPTLGTYDQALTAYTVVMNGVSFTPGLGSGSNFIQVVNDNGQPGNSNYLDAYYVGAGSIVSGQTTFGLFVGLENAFNDFPVSAFAGSATDMPVAAFDVSGFTQRSVDFTVYTFVNGQLRSNSLQGAVSSITAVPPAPPPGGGGAPGGGGNTLPVPSSVWLAGLGLGALGLQRRRVARAAG